MGSIRLAAEAQCRMNHPEDGPYNTNILINDIKKEIVEIKTGVDGRGLPFIKHTVRKYA